MSLVLLLLFPALALLLLGIQRLLNRTRLPDGVRPLPGPKGLPFIGRVHDVPADASWLKFWEWSQVYGPIYQMEIFGSVHVWISSEQIAHDLLSKRSAIYSDRPVIPNLPDNRTSGDYLALQGRTETWKRQRKLCHHLMATSAQASLHGYPAKERDRFLYLMWKDPANYIEWIEQFTSRTVSRLSWGSPHPAQVLRRTTFGLLETISPSGALPNVVSWLVHLPPFLSPWKRKEAARHEEEERLLRKTVSFVGSMRMKGTAEPSFIRRFLEDKDGNKAGGRSAESSTDEAMYVVGQMAIAGALTIGSPIQSYLLAMCHYPDWQAKLQHEIDTVLEGRRPQWDDREKLPLLRAVVKEVIRWRPPVPTGIPHAVEQDDVYNGYFIPKGATIHALEWGITRNEDMYPDPESFNPGRWLQPSYPTYKEPLTTYPNLAGYSQFGFGRRVCQGVPIVEQDLFLGMGGLAWAFSIRKKRARDGAEVPVHWNDFSPLLIAKPRPFEFDALPRSEGKMRMMEKMYRAAKDEMDQNKEMRWHEEGEIDTVDHGDDGESESDHDVLINVRESSSEADSDSDSEKREEERQDLEDATTGKMIPGGWR